MNLPFVISNVLAPADLTDSDLPALRYARHVADHFAAKLTVVYSDPIYPPDFVPRSEVILPPPAPEQRARLRSEVEKHVAPAMNGRPYEVYLTMGHPITAILATSRKLGSDLIVLGTHMRHGWRRALIGSVSEGVLKGSRIAVLTVAAGDHGAMSEPQVKRIICPVNFTAVSRDALHAAERVAMRFGAELVIVHVIEPDAIADPVADEDHVRRWIMPEMQNLCEFREVVVRGDAARRVLDCAEDIRADLLVIKPSGVTYDELTPENMVVCDLGGELVDGAHSPSSDTAAHAYVYRHMPHIGGVVHTHSPYATAWAARGEPIPCSLTAMADEFGGDIPVGPFALIGDDTIGRGIVETLRASNSPAVLMRQHGPFTIGRTAKAAVKAAVMTEDVARTMHLARQLGFVDRLPDHAVEALHDRYQNVYGQR